jgi:sporulation protein YlmC with PRC-barrel domain
MLNKIKDLKGYSIQNIDGDAIGKVEEFYFDDKHWTVRYLVAHTGTWFTGRQMLISPYAVVAVNRDEKSIIVSLTKKQIEDSPPLESHKPVSRQFEESYYGYYGWPEYWNGPYSWGYYPYIERDRKKWDRTTKNAEANWDHHLRSSDEVTGYHIQAEDGDIGHVKDFVVDDGTWTIRYLIIDTQNWLPGRKVLISPRWLTRVSWEERKVFINLSRDTIQQSPEFTDESLLDREYETGLYGHYNREGYWIEEQVSKAAH